MKNQNQGLDPQPENLKLKAHRATNHHHPHPAWLFLMLDGWWFGKFWGGGIQNSKARKNPPYEKNKKMFLTKLC